jgi:prepilin-type N-terminal cleavage/methylation domain-containing protein
VKNIERDLPMKNQLHSTRHFGGSFTLVEMLVVISIIGVLAAMLLPTLAKGKIMAQKKSAQIDIGNIMAAINAYDAQYSRLPASSNAVYAAAAVGEDFTYGGRFPGLPSIYTPGVSYIPTAPNNAELIAILMDWETYPIGLPTVNQGHIYNPQQIKFLNARLSGDTNSPGVGIDGVFRDPWRMPYIITLDLNYDEYTRDAVYRDSKVSMDPVTRAPLVGLIPRPGGSANMYMTVYEAHARAMVWSFGPDKSYSSTQRANTGLNRDNILSWQ